MIAEEDQKACSVLAKVPGATELITGSCLNGYYRGSFLLELLLESRA